ncbi:hypothetical protein [Aidingimonas lacisalsi]|uniref:hypothetical protein n=1 Tax=Aidingimonas lacisalsi TaxID=2604086 RepID=UPI0011D201F1|nr:hypothetical protein [Aidingimonas lacisalsi]
MPWFSLNHMTADDSQALYHYIRSLEPLGDPAPDSLLPGEAPPPPYVDFILEWQSNRLVDEVADPRHQSHDNATMTIAVIRAYSINDRGLVTVIPPSADSASYPHSVH